MLTKQSTSRHEGIGAMKVKNKETVAYKIQNVGKRAMKK